MGKEWIHTDDMQRCRMVEKGVFELIEANEADEDQFIISEPMTIDLKDWMDGEGYSKEAKSIIRSYYSDWMDWVRVPDTCKPQYLAEMIYECTSQFWPDSELYSEEEAMNILDRYCETGVISLPERRLN